MLCSLQHGAGRSPGHVLSTRPKVLPPLLVCYRFIRYQSDLPLTSRGFSVASGMSRKCPPELQSEIDRVLDKQTSTRDSSSHTWGAWMSSEGQALRATIDAPNALIRAVPRVCHREESRPEASSKEGTPATQGRRIMSGSLQHGADPSCSLDPLRSLMSPARCWRFIRYQSALPPVSRGFSAASVIRRKCPP